MFNTVSILEKIEGKVSQLQNYRLIFMDMSTAEKLRNYRQDLINFFFELEREFKVSTQLINCLSTVNTDLNEKSQTLEKNITDLTKENLLLKEKLLINENKISNLTNSNNFLELQTSTKVSDKEKHFKETTNYNQLSKIERINQKSVIKS